jgi:glycosyltransferase involved in cell wall biosynthesis
LVRQLPFPIAWMQTRFAWDLFRTHPEKLFLPIQAAPLLLPRGVEVTATIHDLAFKRYPETFPQKDLFKLNLMLETAVRQADKLIAVSESTKKDLLEFFPGLSETKIRVIHHGFDQEFFGTKLSEEELIQGLQKYHQVPQGYLLYVGALQPRKNLVRLIEAFNQVRKEGEEMKLVLAGEPAWLSETVVEAYERSPYRQDILLTGRVSFEDLRVLYQGARVFVFPSLYEGFGLPLLEAFASGTPVLTAHNSSLIEVAGDGALFCEAENVDDIAQKLKLLWKDQGLQTALREKGLGRLSSFSWEKCAKETLEYILS